MVFAVPILYRKGWAIWQGKVTAIAVPVMCLMRNMDIIGVM